MVFLRTGQESLPLEVDFPRQAGESPLIRGAEGLAAARSTRGSDKILYKPQRMATPFSRRRQRNLPFAQTICRLGHSLPLVPLRYARPYQPYPRLVASLSEGGGICEANDGGSFGVVFRLYLSKFALPLLENGYRHSPKFIRGDNSPSLSPAAKSSPLGEGAFRKAYAHRSSHPPCHFHQLGGGVGGLQSYVYRHRQ